MKTPYYPFLRGKQYELVMLRENAALIKKAGFTPIIEPVKEALAGLRRTVAELARVDSRVIVVVNPNLGEHAEDGSPIQSFLDAEYPRSKKIVAGIFVSSDADLRTVEQHCDANSERPIALIHAGYSKGRELASLSSRFENVDTNVFFEKDSGKLYRKHFEGTKRVLLRDGFQRRANRSHPEEEPFSDLHVTFGDEGVEGFGDFLVVGEDFIEGGGPAYAVAIHLTFIDPDRDSEMFIRHFVSDRVSTPADPAGKFGEALKKFSDELNRRGTTIERTNAVKEFLELAARKHFPGLGYVKKLSMQHHLETIALFADGK